MSVPVLSRTVINGALDDYAAGMPRAEIIEKWRITNNQLKRLTYKTGTKRPQGYVDPRHGRAPLPEREQQRKRLAERREELLARRSNNALIKHDYEVLGLSRQEILDKYNLTMGALNSLVGTIRLKRSPEYKEQLRQRLVDDAARARLLRPNKHPRRADAPPADPCKIIDKLSNPESKMKGVILRRCEAKFLAEALAFWMEHNYEG